MTPYLPAALRACASGFYPAEASAELLISHGSFLDRSDFTGRFIRTGTSVTDRTTTMADIDWPAAITALNTGELPCSRRAPHPPASRQPRSRHPRRPPRRRHWPRRATSST